MSVIFKIAYDTDIRRVSVASNTSFNEFNELVRKLFIESIPDNYVIKYTDDEGDLVSITCDREFTEAFAFATGKPLLRLTIVTVKPKVESKPVPVPTPTKEEPRRTVPPSPLNADPIVGIIEQALDCPELRGLINHFGVSIENVKNIVNGLKQEVTEAFENGKEKVKEGEKEESNDSEQAVHQAYCDHCDKQIVGIRYKCTVCCDFDLCSTCEALLPSASVHDTQHLFLKVFNPASLPCRRPLLRNFYAEPAGSCPYAGRRWGGGPGCRGPWAGRRWGGGPGCHQWRQNNGSATPSPQPPTEGTPVTETCSRWQPRGQNWMSSRFIADVAINDGSQMEPGVPFHKVWRLKNTGTVAWPEGTSLSFVAGDVLGGQDNVILSRVVQPGEEIDVGVDMVAPSKPGRYISNFRLVNPEGISFGHRVWADILVIPSAAPVAEEKQVEQPPQPCTIVIEKKVEEPVVVEEKKDEPAPIPVVEEKKEELPEKKEEEEDKSYIYGEQLAALVAMGFVDRQANKAALAKRKGNVIAAVNDLLN